MTQMMVAERAPAPATLKDADAALQSMQRILAELGKRPEARQTAQFQQIMAKYKELGAKLHEARKRVAPLQPRTAAAIVAAAGPPRQQIHASQQFISALDRAKQQARPVVNNAMANRTPFGAGPGQQVTGMDRARQAYGGQPAVRQLRPVQPPAPAEPPAAVAVAPEPQLSAPAAPPAPRLEPPSCFPLPLPRFKETLGPRGTRGTYEGEQIGNLQRVLAALGFPVELTSRYDDRTVAAVMDFQRAHKLATNGLIGLEMRQALNELVAG